jgi:hypothetical protein
MMENTILFNIYGGRYIMIENINKMWQSCEFDPHCVGSMVCGECQQIECDCDATYKICHHCRHRHCQWCHNNTLKRSDEFNECQECINWDHVGDPCDLSFCVTYLGGNGKIAANLACDQCHSQPSPQIRVPLAFSIPLDTLLIEYPTFSNIANQFLKFYSYSHTTQIWEPYPATEFRLAQEYFDLDDGVIVLGRSRDDEDRAKGKSEKQLRKLQKKERRQNRLQERVNQILSI